MFDWIRKLMRTPTPAPTQKKFKLARENIERLVYGYGGCIASDLITVEGLPVRFMYREQPARDADSGWRFLAGVETQEYMDNAGNHGVYDVNTIANCDRSIIPFLDAPPGSVFEKAPERDDFQPVHDWRPRED